MRAGRYSVVPGAAFATFPNYPNKTERAGEEYLLRVSGHRVFKMKIS